MPSNTDAETRADQEFKAACKVMTDKRKVRDALVKRREQRELSDSYKVALEKIVSLENQYGGAVQCIQDQGTDLERARAEFGLWHAEALEAAAAAESTIRERDARIEALERKLAAIHGVVQGAVDCQQPLAA